MTVAAQKRTRRLPRIARVVPYRTLWVAFVDHSILGAWPRKKLARDAVRTLLSRSLLKVSFLIAPFVFREGAQPQLVSGEDA